MSRIRRTQVEVYGAQRAPSSSFLVHQSKCEVGGVELLVSLGEADVTTDHPCAERAAGVGEDYRRRQVEPHGVDLWDHQQHHEQDHHEDHMTQKGRHHSDAWSYRYHGRM